MSLTEAQPWVARTDAVERQATESGLFSIVSSFECGNACPNTGTQLPAFVSKLKLAPWRLFFQSPWHEPCLTEVLAAIPKPNATKKFS